MKASSLFPRTQMLWIAIQMTIRHALNGADRWMKGEKSLTHSANASENVREAWSYIVKEVTL